MKMGRRLLRETILLQTKVEEATSRLSRARVELQSVLEVLTDLPSALKTGVIHAIEAAFVEVQQAEFDVARVAEIVRLNHESVRDRASCTSLSRHPPTHDQCLRSSPRP
jgi:hypothetical protein